MPMLTEYAAKRNRGKTVEPPAEISIDARNRFVVQKHHASHLHYDFRLELDGVLKSWAVPKGPPQTVGEKKLAVEVEDHPVSYLTFEGVIPDGQYGAGTVEIWDSGTFELITRDNDGFKFILSGKKLHGEYILFRFRKSGPKNWLLEKK